MNLKENNARSKEALLGWVRQGAHEIGAVLYGPGTAAQSPEHGMPFTKTPGEVASSRRTDEFNEEPRQAPSDAPAADRDEPGDEREID
jgi:hypothetical protein